jgi:hypothetical protein
MRVTVREVDTVHYPVTRRLQLSRDALTQPLTELTVHRRRRLKHRHLVIKNPPVKL